MKEIQLTQAKVALVDDEDFELVSRYKWRLHCDGYNEYARATIDGKRIHMHRLLMQAPAGYVVDHRNSVGTDNRRENLRLCTHAENMRNQRRFSNNSSGFTGVYYKPEKGGPQYRSTIYLNNEEVHLGYFQTAKEAAVRRDIAALELHGEYARLNFPHLRNMLDMGLDA